VEVDLEDASITDLCAAFARILSSIGDVSKTGHAVVYDDTPIGLHAEDIMDRLTREGPLTLQKVFAGRTRRVEMIGLFLATLELVRLKKVRIIQEQVGGEIRLESRPPEEQLNDQDSANVDWRDPETGEMQYEWASEEDRKRAARRARLRALAAERMKKGQEVSEEELEELDEADDDEVEASDQTPAEENARSEQDNASSQDASDS
jgi:segregation and condensation protein A